MNNEQEYELVDFNIEDLKEGSKIENGTEVREIQSVLGKIILSIVNSAMVNLNGHVRINTLEDLKDADFKLQVPKPKLEKIQGFEVREYPEMPLVEVSDYANFRVYTIKNLMCVDRKMSSHFFRCSNNNYKYCRPVPLEKRNFIDIEE